jgi:light-regulated signal transduction histidine kinase (bacteriophytochrome)
VERHRAANTDVIGGLPDGRWIQVIERPTTDGGVIGIRMNITAMKQKEAELEETTRQLEEHGRELKRSNTELEQFAYVASHDLQEPLRMVGSYCQLLKRRYAGKLDTDADDFIGFAVEGASRMQRLINDLLSYSRVGHRGEAFAPLQAGDIVRAALGNLEGAITDAGAVVDVGDLPEINGDRTQLVQLFQNLIGNAIKFRRDEAPVVRISAAQKGEFAQFTVEDNGIGIEREYVEKIFLIFQRLHDREKYSGTGIGLAIVKKVVEHHGGKVWIDSTPGQGSRFEFTLPLIQRSQSDE